MHSGLQINCKLFLNSMNFLCQSDNVNNKIKLFSFSFSQFSYICLVHKKDFRRHLNAYQYFPAFVSQKKTKDVCV